MSYTCVYDKTIFYNPVTKYSVISMKTSDRSIPEKARSAYRHRDRLIRFVAVGYELPRTDQVSMILEGEWKDGKNGYQLYVSQCEEIVPQTKDGVQGYLASRLIKGVGEKTAAAIVDRFGADALHVLENEPERLLEIKGITEAKLEDIKTSYMGSRTLRDLMILLSPFKVTPVTATKIYGHFGAKSVDILQNNPFELCQISGFGFRRVDAIILKNNWPLNSAMRIQGAVYSALETERSENGHLFLAIEELKKAAMKLLNEKIPLPQMRIKTSEVESVVQEMVLQGRIICSNENYYQRSSFIQEDETARQIAEIISKPMSSVDIHSTLDGVRGKLGVELSQRQTEAVYMTFRHNLSIITGSPGTGKTTVLKAVIEVFRQLNPNGKILLAAPTGRASRRMAESTGISEARTLHSALGLLGEEGVFRKERQDKPLDADLIIVDETSMMDMWLARRFFTRVKLDTKVLLVGDADQLQSVGAGDVFRELIGCGLIPVTTLNEIFRQKRDSLIAYNAKKINEDNTNFYYGSDFFVCKCTTQDEAAAHIQSIYCEQVKQYGPERVQILSPFRSTGEASVERLNELIRETVNPQQDEIPDLKVGGMYFRTGDKVMQNKNNNKASNGDIGFIRSIARTEKKELKITISFSGAREVEYGLEDMVNIELAYATTVHKAMGSEFDVVIFPIIKSHTRMLIRSVVYTAITRAKCRVILVGQLGMLFMAVHRNDTGKRNTQLGKQIGLYAKAFAAARNSPNQPLDHEQLKKIS
jgi:exodeoxyribonuclease V alpha subunit